jgi:ribosomal protein L15
MLLQVNTNWKTIKSMKYGFLTGILYLAPYKLSGKNVCPAASLGCRLSCLNTAGRGQMGVVQKARLRKTKMFFRDRNKFLSQLKTEIEILSRRAANKNMKLAIRLNGTSDLPFERYLIDGKNLMDHFPKVKFYDYTKLENRINDQLPGNYHLTFSRSETNEAVIDQVIEKAPVSVVFKNKLPRLYNGYKVINGDLHDMRFKNQSGVIIGLIAKGKARKDTTGFAI